MVKCLEGQTEIVRIVKLLKVLVTLEFSSGEDSAGQVLLPGTGVLW